MSDKFGKTLVIIIAWVVCFLPTWIFLGIRYLAAPEGFWQNIVLFGLGVWFLGGLQILGFIVAVIITLSVAND